MRAYDPSTAPAYGPGHFQHGDFHGGGTPRTAGSVYLGLAAVLLVASGGFLIGHQVITSEPGVSEAEAASFQGEAVDPAEIQAVVAGYLASGVAVRAGDRSVDLTWAQLGVVADPDESRRVAVTANPDDILGSLRERGALPVRLDRAAASDHLARLATKLDRPPRSARMDLEARVIHPSSDGRSVDVYASMAAIEEAARRGSSEVELSVVPLPPRLSSSELGIDDISHVLASFETNFSTSDFERNYNLKLAASKLNGFVMQPGVEFSFNDVVGARTENEGYKIAHVITAGEMVDGLAGGTCQISTTLHGAAFFAGIGILNAIPHSRPSTYVQMGLDATVVYPQVDLVLRNDYDFPVVIHYKVTRGRSYVEILGKERPYDKVVYERQVKEKLEFDTITREDDTMPVGSMAVDQYGFYGYKLERVRKFYKDGKVVKRNRWPIRYAPVTEYARLGTNPDPNILPPKAGKKGHRLKEPSTKTYRLAQ